MIKNFRKFLPNLLLTAILLIAGGFSDGMVAEAKMSSMNDGMQMPVQTAHFVNKKIVLSQNEPRSNSLKPCCENKQGGASAVQAADFDQVLKISLNGFSDSVSSDNFVSNHRIIDYSSASPPKPDILSSVLKKE